MPKARRHLGQGGTDILILGSGLNWVMGFEHDADRLKISGMTDAGLRAAAMQVGEQLHVALLSEGGDSHLVWTTLGAFDLLAKLKRDPCGLLAGTNLSPNDSVITI